jgi:DNA-binding beta-propeller fold protein YncE
MSNENWMNCFECGQHPQDCDNKCPVRPIDNTEAKLLALISVKDATIRTLADDIAKHAHDKKCLKHAISEYRAEVEELKEENKQLVASSKRMPIFPPATIAWSPINGHVYVDDSEGNCLVEFDTKGKVINSHRKE